MGKKDGRRKWGKKNPYAYETRSQTITTMFMTKAAKEQWTVCQEQLGRHRVSEADRGQVGHNHWWMLPRPDTCHAKVRGPTELTQHPGALTCADRYDKRQTRPTRHWRNLGGHIRQAVAFRGLACRSGDLLGWWLNWQVLFQHLSKAGGPGTLKPVTFGRHFLTCKG